MLGLAARLPGTGLPNRLLAAVHFLVRRDGDGELCTHYPSANSGQVADDPSRPYPAFRGFVQAHEEDLFALAAERQGQTNEVQRCVYLLPAFSYIAELEDGSPLALIEVGTSAGLNMLWDHYRYEYSNGQNAGAPGAPLCLRCEVRNEVLLPIADTGPEVGWKVAIDLEPIDTSEYEEALWAESFLWPDQSERLARARAAMAVARRHRPEIRKGNAAELLAGVLEEVPGGLTLCVTHTDACATFLAKTDRRSRPSSPNTRSRETSGAFLVKGGHASSCPTQIRHQRGKKQMPHGHDWRSSDGSTAHRSRRIWPTVAATGTGSTGLPTEANCALDDDSTLTVVFGVRQCQAR